MSTADSAGPHLIWLVLLISAVFRAAASSAVDDDGGGDVRWITTVDLPSVGFGCTAEDLAAGNVGEANGRWRLVDFDYNIKLYPISAPFRRLGSGVRVVKQQADRVYLSCGLDWHIQPPEAAAMRCRGDGRWPVDPADITCADASAASTDSGVEGCQPPKLRGRLTFQTAPAATVDCYQRGECQVFDRDAHLYLPGVTIEFDCDRLPSSLDFERYVVDGAARFVCHRSGRWLPIDNEQADGDSRRLLNEADDDLYGAFPPGCQRVIECSPPVLDESTILLSDVDYYSRRTEHHSGAAFTAGDQVRFGCAEPQQTLVGQPALVCLANGQWNAEAPHCGEPDHARDRRFIAVASALAMLLLLLIAVLTVVIHRRIVLMRAHHHRQLGGAGAGRHHHHAQAHRGTSGRHGTGGTRRSPSAGPASSAATNLSMLRHTLSALHSGGNSNPLAANNQSALSVLDADRLALLAYLEEGAGLPTYDEAMNVNVVVAEDGNRTRSTGQLVGMAAQTTVAASTSAPPNMAAAAPDSNVQTSQSAPSRLRRLLLTTVDWRPRGGRLFGSWRGLTNRRADVDGDTHALAPTSPVDDDEVSTSSLSASEGSVVVVTTSTNDGQQLILDGGGGTAAADDATQTAEQLMTVVDPASVPHPATQEGPSVITSLPPNPVDADTDDDDKL